MLSRIAGTAWSLRSDSMRALRCRSLSAIVVSKPPCAMGGAWT